MCQWHHPAACAHNIEYDLLEIQVHRIYLFERCAWGWGWGMGTFGKWGTCIRSLPVPPGTRALV